MSSELEIDDQLDELDDPEPPHTMQGVVALLVGTVGLALLEHLTETYRLGAGRAGVEDPQPVELGQLDHRLEQKLRILDSSLGADLLARLEAATEPDDIDAAIEALNARAESFAGSAWSMYQAGFKDFGVPDQMVDFVGPDDDRDCDGCADAVTGGPYPLASAPEPGGQECGDHCRHELVPLEDGEVAL